MKRFVIVALGMSLGACLSHPPPAPAPYRAVGLSADWTLIIGDRYRTFFPGPGQQPILAPSVEPIIGIAGEIYQTPRINVNVVHGQCNDGRSDRAYPAKAQV